MSPFPEVRLRRLRSSPALRRPSFSRLAMYEGDTLRTTASATEQKNENTRATAA